VYYKVEVLYVGKVSTIPLKVRVGRRFTITIPKEVREKLGIKEGDELDLIVVNDSIVLRKPMSLLEFINNIKPRGSVKVFLKERVVEEKAEDERVKELT